MVYRRLSHSIAGLFTTNVAYGGADGRDLYITESEIGTILRARMPVPGKPMVLASELTEPGGTRAAPNGAGPA